MQLATAHPHYQAAIHDLTHSSRAAALGPVRDGEDEERAAIGGIVSGWPAVQSLEVQALRLKQTLQWSAPLGPDRLRFVT